MMTRLIVAIAGALLSACAPFVQLDGKYDGEDAGYAVLSLGAAKPVHFSSLTLHYRPAGSAESDRVEGQFFFAPPWLPSSGRPDFDTAHEQGVVIVAALAPGDYEIFSTTAFENYGTVQTTFKSSRPFSIPFTVRAGEAVYLGSFRSRTLTGKNVFGIEVTAGVVFEISDAAERDMDLARRRESRLPNEVALAIPDPTAVGSPIFTRGMQDAR